MAKEETKEVEGNLKENVVLNSIVERSATRPEVDSLVEGPVILVEVVRIRGPVAFRHGYHLRPRIHQCERHHQEDRARRHHKGEDRGRGK